MSEQVDHPIHYNSSKSGIEVIDIVRHENFNVGNSIKYILRHQDKGNPIQDLKKAIWYLEDEIKRLENEKPKDSGSVNTRPILPEITE